MISVVGSNTEITRSDKNVLLDYGNVVEENDSE
jgi:hypothetical protein